MRQMKDSGVKWIGEVPEGWTISLLSTFFCERKEKNISNKETNLLSLSYGSVINKDINTKEGLLPESFEGYNIIQPNDIVFRLTDLQNDKRSLRSAINHQVGIITSAYTTIFQRADVLDNTFYHFFFRALDECKVLYGIGSGVRQSMNYKDLAKLKLCVPPLPEQQAIASYLDKKCGEIDSLVGLQEEMIAELKAYKQSVITEAVTKGLDPDAKMKDSGVEWIGEVPEGWELIRLRFLCNINTGGQDTVNRVDDGIYPFFVRSPKIERINTYCYDGEAIMMAGDGVGAGRVFHHYNGKFDCHQRVYYLYDFQIVEGMFLYYYLSSNFYKLIDAGSAKSTVDSVRLPMLTNFPVLIPTLQVQQQIATYLDTKTSEIDQLITIKQQKITELKEYKKSLIYECVTGKKEILQTTN